MCSSDLGGAPGTVIEVRSLFFNVPARRKFLRTESTEYAHIEQQFRLHAIANPAVAFTLVRDGAAAFHLPMAQSVLERIRGLSGDELAARLIEVKKLAFQGITVWGYIGGPGLSRSSRQQQITFLNGRPIESSSINYGLREGFHTTLMKGQYPVTFLFLEMDAHAFDINVHPAKREVRFHDGFAVRDAVARAVSQALGTTTKLPEGHAVSRPPVQLQPSPDVPRQQPLPLSAPVAAVTSAATKPQPPTPAPLATQQPAPAPQPVPVSSDAKPQMPSFRIIGILHRLYVLMESAEGLVLMDQHAAHERVNFEKMRRAMEQGGVPSQRLLMPLTLQTSPREADILMRHLEPLARLGIEAEPFGPNIFKIEALPTFLKTDDPLAWLDQVIEELQSLSSKSSALRLGEDMIATTVCRHSVKANDKLSLPEVQALLDDLFACEMPYCCPHGRPTLIQMSLGELERKFGRQAP